MEAPGHHHQHAVESSVGSVFTNLSWLGLLLILVAYALAARAQRLQNKRWSPWRTVSFAAGITLLACGISPHVMAMAHHSFKWHMVQHLVIGMLAPIALVIGAPVTLLLRSISVKQARRVIRFLKRPSILVLTHPATALVLNVGGMAALYATPLYAASFENHAVHHLIHVHFLLAGYLYAWAIAGPDPAPARPSFKTRLFVHFLGMGLHANLSKWMYGFHFPKNTHHSAADIEAGAKLMFYGGDAAELLLAVALFATWYQSTQWHRENKTSRVRGPGSVPPAMAST